MDELLLTEEELAELAASDPESYAEILKLQREGYDTGPSRLNDQMSPEVYGKGLSPEDMARLKEAHEYDKYLFGPNVDLRDHLLPEGGLERSPGSLGNMLKMEMSLDEAIRRGIVSGESRPGKDSFDPSDSAAYDRFLRKKDSLDLSEEAAYSRFLKKEEMAKAAQKMAADRMLGKSRGAAPARQDTVPGAVASSAEEDLAYVEDMLLGDGVSSGATMAELSRAPRRKVLPTMSGLGGDMSSGLSQRNRDLTGDFLLQSHRFSKDNPDSDAYESARKAVEESGLFPVRGGRSSFSDESVDHIPIDPVDEGFNPEDLEEMGSYAPYAPYTDDKLKDEGIFTGELGKRAEGLAYIKNAMAGADAVKGLPAYESGDLSFKEALEMQKDLDRRGLSRSVLSGGFDPTEDDLKQQRELEFGGVPTPVTQQMEDALKDVLSVAETKEADKGDKKAMGSMTPQKRRAFRVGQMQKRQEAAGGPVERSPERQAAQNVIEAMVASRNQGQELATLMPSINQFSKQIREISRPDASLKDLESRIQAASTPQELNALQAQAEKVTSQFGSNAATSRIADSIDSAASTMSSHYKIENAKESDRNQIAADVFGAMSADELAGYADKHGDYLSANPVVKTRLSSSLKAMRDKVQATAERLKDRARNQEQEDILFNLTTRQKELDNILKRLNIKNFGKEKTGKVIEEIKKGARRKADSILKLLNDPKRRGEFVAGGTQRATVLNDQMRKDQAALNDLLDQLVYATSEREAKIYSDQIEAIVNRISGLSTAEEMSAYETELVRRRKK